MVTQHHIHMNSPKFDSDRLYSVATLAELLDVSRATVWRWVKNGDAPPLCHVGQSSTRGRSADWNPFIADPEGWRATHRQERVPEAA
jgi:predicted DNA-binding transcriptional regulator AlpA